MMTSFAVLVGNIRKTFIPAQFKFLKPGQHAYDNYELLLLFRITTFLDVSMFWTNVMWVYCLQWHLCCRLGFLRFWFWLALLSFIAIIVMLAPMSYAINELDLSWCRFRPNSTLERLFDFTLLVTSEEDDDNHRDNRSFSAYLSYRMELSLSELLSHDDWIYTDVLVSSFFIALVLRLSQGYFMRTYASGAIGFAMAVIVLGWKVFYSLFLAVCVAIAILYASRRWLTSIVFVTSFVYLIFIRYLHYIVNVEELASQANVVQLIMTLRVIGLSFEVSDSHRARAESDLVERRKRFLESDPGILDILNYFYHFAGLFTAKMRSFVFSGPYYTYQMLLDSGNSVLFDHWSPISEIRERALRLCWSIPLFVIVNQLYPLDVGFKRTGLRSDEIWRMSFSQRMLYAAAVFIVFRARVYSAWAVAESICVVLGLGVYPVDSMPRIVVGPTDLEKFRELSWRPDIAYNSEAIVNLDIYEVEFRSTSDYQIEMGEGIRRGIRSWNKSVQSWLALYVYSRTNQMYRVELTMFVSALWHGTYAGYFMSFLAVPMCTSVEDTIFKYMPVNEFTNKRPLWFRYL
ncbi:MBOAT family protein [Dictyocaulus viviparus]|uniref:Lysophospholipid acyltransferase 7 n=1 Tax=Dictyocaulus viviparus TaxID=29172 RepID=A0A0D8XEC6_DICVI|nr:MBOAT family protein [Dictyocaulus viviparus]